MTDKEKIRKEVERIINRRLNLINGDYFDLNEETNGFTNEIIDIIDSLQKDSKFKVGQSIKQGDVVAKIAEVSEEGYHCDNAFVPFTAQDSWELVGEPVSEDLEEELDSYIKDNFTIDKEQLDRFGLDEKDYMYSMDKSDMLKMVRHFTELKHKKDVVITEDLIATAFANGMADMKQKMINAHGYPEESVTEDLGEYINELAKQFPEVSFAKLSRIAVRVAKWQEKKDQSTIELAEDHAMLAGMEKMKEQMMEKAVETTFNVSLPSSLYDKLWIKGCKEGDKLLVIKEDEL